MKTNLEIEDVDALAFDLKNLCRRCNEGSFATQVNRDDMLQLMARELKAAGFHLPSARSLKPKHVWALVLRWQSLELSDGTIANRLAAVRWWAEKANKASVVLRTNEDYGVRASHGAFTDKARKLDRDKVDKLTDPHVRMSVEAQALFGLRREEAIKFNPSYADKGDRIALKGSWCKGGKAREILITHAKQRDWLNRAHLLCGKGALIPPERNYVEQLAVYEYQTVKAGLRNNHGLRHGWAQWRYKQLTNGMDAPARGGIDPKTLSGSQRARDLDARRALTRELGHERISVTAVYLGG